MRNFRIIIPSPGASSCVVRFVHGGRQIARGISSRYPGVALFLVSDRNVFPLYGKPLHSELSALGAITRSIVLPAGEKVKSVARKTTLDDRLLAGGVRRDSVIIALGGGVIGDLAGFSAATLLRGIRLIQVPTSLLAQVDSSVGGKVGINHRLGKNLIGAFHQPEEVYVATSMLRTLPPREYLSGLGEVIKYGMILDPRLFRELENDPAALLSRRSRTMENVIARCIRLKAAVVAADEREEGPRRILNFGHTVGHAIESLSGYRISHGQAVSIGMVVEGAISRDMGLLRGADFDRLRNLISACGLPTSPPRSITAGQMLRAISRDKKYSGGEVRFTLARAVGRAETGCIVPHEILTNVLRG
jgi:3-dehydroquinate synthase